MYLGKRKVEYETGVQLVPFCKDCNSQEIETIQTCKKCGSHNIGGPNLNIIDSDKRSEKIIYEYKEEPYYKCDYCGKEFNGLKIPKTISFVDGDFELGSYTDETDYILTIDKDVCLECLDKVRDSLQKDLLKLLNPYSFKNKVENILQKEGSSNESNSKG